MTVTCAESDKSVLTQIYDPNGNAMTMGEIVCRLNESAAEIERLKRLQPVCRNGHPITQAAANALMTEMDGWKTRTILSRITNERLQARIAELEAEAGSLATTIHTLSPSDPLTEAETDCLVEAATREGDR